VAFIHKLALVIPTKDRPDDLRRMLGSVDKQSVRPAQLIVVDGSNPDVRHVVDSFPGLEIEYVRVFPPSLAKQRNAGMARLRHDISMAGYLDDDVVLEPEAIETVLAFWETADANIGGVSFNIVNAEEPRGLWVKSLFGLDGYRRGAVLPSGWTTAPGSPRADLEVDWLCGGATIWRRDIIDHYTYDEWFQGMGFLEDVDYSFNIREKYRLMVVSLARLVHNSPPIKPDRHFLLGRYQIINRLYFVRKYRRRGLSVIRAWIAIVAMIMMHLAQAVILLERAHLNHAFGNLVGVFAELRGRQERISGFLK
jgi:glycosyltransferase involved in cell wall biosynthesis